MLRERLTELLMDPVTGRVHHRLQPVFEELVGSDRPQTGIYWLRRKPGDGPRLLRQMARGQIDISHETFRALPSDRAHNYLRDLLVAVGVLPGYEPRIDRIERWLEVKVAALPAEEGDLIRRFARWRILRHLREVAAQGRLSKAINDRAREQICAAIRLLEFFDTHGLTAATATQASLERYQEAAQLKTLTSQHAFITWLRASGTNTALTARAGSYQVPSVTMSEEDRWQGVRRLLGDTSLRRYTRIAGLFTLLFAQPLTRIVAMRTTQVSVRSDGGVEVRFHTVAIPMPAILDDLVREHLGERGLSQYGRHNAGWLFPGGQPGHHLQTENIRRQLVDLGIRPLESRKAALYQLAAATPAPILAELLGTTENNAANWARLAARDWTGYIADRAR
jgi:hypothetical protein